MSARALHRRPTSITRTASCARSRSLVEARRSEARAFSTRTRESKASRTGPAARRDGSDPGQGIEADFDHPQLVNERLHDLRELRVVLENPLGTVELGANDRPGILHCSGGRARIQRICFAPKQVVHDAEVGGDQQPALHLLATSGETHREYRDPDAKCARNEEQRGLPRHEAEEEVRQAWFRRSGGCGHQLKSRTAQACEEGAEDYGCSRNGLANRIGTSHASALRTQVPERQHVAGVTGTCCSPGCRSGLALERLQ